MQHMFGVAPAPPCNIKSERKKTFLSCHFDPPTLPPPSNVKWIFMQTVCYLMCGTNPRHIFFASCHCAHNVVFVPVHLAPLLKGYAPMARGTKSGGNLQNSSCTYKLLSTTIPVHNILMLRICYFRLCDDANAKKFMFSQNYQGSKSPWR